MEDLVPGILVGVVGFDASVGVASPRGLGEGDPLELPPALGCNSIHSSRILGVVTWRKTGKILGQIQHLGQVLGLILIEYSKRKIVY